MNIKDGYYFGQIEDVQAWHDALHAQPEIPVQKANGYQMLKWDDVHVCYDNQANAYIAKPHNDILLYYLNNDQDRINSFRSGFVDGKLSVFSEKQDGWDAPEEDI